MPRVGQAEGQALLERFRRYLRDQHQPVTRQRDVVAEIVLLADDHLSVGAIQRRLKERGHRIGLATVYRVLEILVASGLVKAHDFGEGFRRFEPVTGQGRHEHLVCTRCGRVLEFSNEQLERMLPIIADEHQFQVQRHRVEIYGVCQLCQERELGPFPVRGEK
ncbi:MAG TPA: Fur family transcriptional regulator [Gemmatimonadales bacterium]|jgi:Fur family ferric uptake transcriptional regulator|nr:Fur family transcriptional regulator [Gemmatimonadales bacterium]